MVLVGIVTGLAYIPWLPILMDISSNAESGYHSAIVVNKQGLEIIAFHLFGVPYNIFIVLSLAGFIGTFHATRWQAYLPNKKTLLVGLWLIVPLILPIFSDLLFDYGLLNHRSMIGLIPALSILIAHVLVQLRRWAFNLFFAILIINNLTTTGSGGPPLGPWWEVATAMTDCMGENDLLVIESNDILQLVTFEQHAELAGIARSSIYRVKHLQDPNLIQIQARLNQDTSIDTVCWVEYLDHSRGVNTINYLGRLGFVQTAPSVNFPQEHPDYNARYILLDEITIGHYSRQPVMDSTLNFGDILLLQNTEHFQRENRYYLDLLWKPTRDLEQEYIISAFLLSMDKILVAQHDSLPFDGRSSTTTWQTHMLYSDRRSFDISNLSAGQYQLGLQVYSSLDVVNLLINP